MLGENVVALLDIAGYVRHIVSDVETTSDDIYGVVLKVDDYNEVLKINVKGESKSYDFDGDITSESGLNISDLDNLQDAVNSSADKYAVVRFTLDKDGVIEELHVYATVEPDQADTTGWKVTPPRCR